MLLRLVSVHCSHSLIVHLNFRHNIFYTLVFCTLGILRKSTMVAQWLRCSAADLKDMSSICCSSCISMEAKCWRLMYCAMLVHIKVPRWLKLSGALHYGVPHKHIMVLPLKTPEIIIIIVLNKLLKKLSVRCHIVRGLKVASCLCTATAHRPLFITRAIQEAKCCFTKLCSFLSIDSVCACSYLHENLALVLLSQRPITVVASTSAGKLCQKALWYLHFCNRLYIQWQPIRVMELNGHCFQLSTCDRRLKTYLQTYLAAWIIHPFFATSISISMLKLSLLIEKLMLSSIASTVLYHMNTFVPLS